MDPDSAKSHSRNDSPQGRDDRSLTFEEETHLAEKYIETVVQTVRTQDVPQETEPAFLFHLIV